MRLSDETIKKYPSLQKVVDAGDAYEDWRDGRESKLLNYIFSEPNIENMRGRPAKILATMDAFASQQDFLINIGPHKGAILAEVVAKNKPQVVVELGGYIGYSAILIAQQMRKASGTTASRVWSLEADPVFAAFAMSLVDLAGLNDIVRIVTGPAERSLRRLHQTSEVEHIDLLFLDHFEELYLKDFRLCEKLGLCNFGSIIIANNVIRPGAPDYRVYVQRHPDLDTRGVRGLIVPGDLEDELEISVFK